MDYVLFGMGYGATLMLLGWALRTYGPQLKYATIADTDDVDKRVRQRHWVRFSQGLGGVVAIAGTAIVLLTFIVMLINPDNGTGAMMSMVVWVFVVAAVFAWCFLYVKHYGITGIWHKDEGYGVLRRQATPRPAARRVTRTPTVHPAIATDPYVAAGSPADHATQPEIANTAPEISEIGDQEAVDQPEDSDVVALETSEFDAELTQESPDDAASTVEYDFGDGADTTVPSEIGGRSEALRRLRERQNRTGPSS